MSFPKQTLPEAVCQQLREAILAHRWRTSLPGIRVLCEEIQVSRQTMMFALRLLEGEGVILPAVHGRPRMINQAMVAPAEPNIQKKSEPVIVLIAWQKETELSETDAELCSHIKKLAESEGFRYRHLAYRYIMRAMGAKKLAYLVKQNPADVYVVMSAHKQCASALRRTGVPLIYIGGEQVKGCVPRISYSLNQMCDLAIKRLVALKHKRITVMLPEGINLASRKASAGEQMVERLFQPYNLPFSTYNCPRWGKTKDDFNEALENLFSLTPPTALILGDVKHVTRVVCFLMRRKLSYPEDVSIIVLDEAKELLECHPVISHIKGNNRLFARSVLKSVRRKLTHQDDQDLEVVPTHLVETGSITEAKAN